MSALVFEFVVGMDSVIKFDNRCLIESHNNYKDCL